jgi:hypothetical protein
MPTVIFGPQPLESIVGYAICIVTWNFCQRSIHSQHFIAHFNVLLKNAFENYSLSIDRMLDKTIYTSEQEFSFVIISSSKPPLLRKLTDMFIKIF